MTSITIKHDSYLLELHDVAAFETDFTIAQVKKLWKLMFEASYDNEKAIETIRLWLGRRYFDFFTVTQQRALSAGNASATYKHKSRRLKQMKGIFNELEKRYL